MSKITTHVLDIAQGRPAQGVPVVLELQIAPSAWKVIGENKTDSDGRSRNLLAPDYPLQAGNYRIRFDTNAYFASQSVKGFYPEVTVIFTVRDTTQHYHVPLLLSPFGYSTYRGS